VVDLKNALQLFSLGDLLFFFLFIRIYQNVEYPFKHGEGIVPYKRQELALLFALLCQRIYYPAKRIV